MNDLFETWYDAMSYSVPFDSSLNDPGVHSGSHGYGKVRTCAAILLQNSLKQLKYS